MNKKRSTPPNPAAAAREAAQRKARDDRQQNRESPEHRHLPEGVPYRDPVSPLEEQFNPMHQALPEAATHLWSSSKATTWPITSSIAPHPTHPFKATTSPIRFCWAITWNTPFPPSSSMDW